MFTVWVQFKEGKNDLIWCSLSLSIQYICMSACLDEIMIEVHFKERIKNTKINSFHNYTIKMDKTCINQESGWSFYHRLGSADWQAGYS